MSQNRALINPRNSTWFTRPFSHCERVGSGDETSLYTCACRHERRVTKRALEKFAGIIQNGMA